MPPFRWTARHTSSSSSILDHAPYGQTTVPADRTEPRLVSVRVQDQCRGGNRRRERVRVEGAQRDRSLGLVLKKHTHGNGREGLRRGGVSVWSTELVDPAKDRRETSESVWTPYVYPSRPPTSVSHLVYTFSTLVHKLAAGALITTICRL